ncbi:hypothetical protein AT352_13685 [Salmonella enterica subsp. enterica serovar Derby]|uniref:Uncharacterized protein n=2 Tax=Salmonella enterica TaxID=28901 RepID=A0A601XSF4_SALDE|nr:hypothetical protein [Salmonella enterica]EBL4646994.1 hypothetical protein [Salmonella enterica subsp. enterica serovar Derby]EBZ9701432.1 hypothetical protein [Salmonella enterica subsp. enterica serovar Derby]ECT6131911.1 hypothetical protein [Salmonella enterica subsp. enterica serovar Derby]ECX1520575.1 hypothetical protein [Salmonella enterica subsp. enterica serovar Derby]ECX6867527.1 hypothetical protein [Salmonella enterica subsp. enterica serovar Derby]
MMNKMNNYSPNWYLLHKLLVDETPVFTRDRLWTYKEHQHARALAIYLAHATLATPVLNKTTIAELLSGSRGWPCKDGKHHFIQTNCSLDFLEDAGFLSFYADWCSVHCQHPWQTEVLDDSIIDILNTAEQLKQIRLGLNDFIEPHFCINVNELTALLSEEFGNVSLETLLPLCTRINDAVSVAPETSKFTPLHSTYLWQTLLEKYPAEEAFRRWMLCIQVQGRAIVPVLFSLLEKKQEENFLEEIERFLSSELSSSYSLKTIFKQVTNSRYFRQLVEPRTIQFNVSINKDMPEIGMKSEISATGNITAQDLDALYMYPAGDDPDEMEAFEKWEQRGYEIGLSMPLTWLIQECLIHSIYIDRQCLRGSSFLLNLLVMAKINPVLRHILFNILPQRFTWTYMLFLLSRVDTCDTALVHLTSRETLHTLLSSYSGAAGIEKTYREALLKEYLRTIESCDANGQRLLKIAYHIADLCSFYNDNYIDSPEYRMLTCLLQRLDDASVLQLVSSFIKQLEEQLPRRVLRLRERSIYYIGFWLAERIEKVEGNHNKQIQHELCTCLYTFYQTAFEECFSGKRRDLEPGAFFASLPWASLIAVKGASPLLSMSVRILDWRDSLTYKNENWSAVASAIRHYMQTLMCVVKCKIDVIEQKRVWRKVTEIVCSYGFGKQEGRVYIFDRYITDNARDLWVAFSVFLNSIPDDLYVDFIEQCKERIPVSSLYIMLDHCHILAREQVLQDIILSRRDLDKENLGLNDLELAFISACDNNHLKLAWGGLQAAKPILSRLKGMKNLDLLERICRWEGYAYKYEHLRLFMELKDNPDEYIRASKLITFKKPNIDLSENNIHFKNLCYECDQFSRYICAIALYKSDPEKSVSIMESLCRTSKSLHHSFALFVARVEYGEKVGDLSILSLALDKFLISIKETKPEDIGTQWASQILDVMRKLKFQHQADIFWRKLTPEQRNTKEIMLPYCLALLERNEVWAAQQIIDNYRKLNAEIGDDTSLMPLLEKLNKSLPEEPVVTGIFRAMVESQKNSTFQLAQQYGLIVSRKFNEYVEIIGNGQTTEIFLKDVVISIGRELLMRKKNLQLQASGRAKGTITNQITNEDLINDWFTSLFDMRMSEARIGFGDQKRMGRSASGQSIGEIDGVIKHSDNTRIAIFEAFRLFSLEKRTISGHLDKISSYDNEGLSPVFIIVYCDIDDFTQLTKDYKKYVSDISYAGFTDKKKRVETVEITDQLWLGKEVRYRVKDIVFYHLLLNMR